MSQQSPSFDARFGTIISTVDDEKQISSLDRLNRESYPSELCNDDLFADGEKFTEIEGSNEKIHAVNLDQPSSTASVDTSNDSGSDSESDTDKMNASVHERPLHLSDDGRTLSAYEMQRLERIKRNRDYLAQLGLEDKGKNSQPEQSKSHQKIKKDESRPVPTRAIISRRSKAKPIRYAEPSNSVRDLLNDKVDGISLNLADTSAASLPVIPIDAVNNTKSEPTSDTMPCETNVLLNESSEKAGLIELGSVHQRQNNKTEKRKHERMEHFVYKEFCRLKSHKNQVLKDVEKLHRASEKEVRLWKGKWDKWNVKWKRRQLRLEMEREEKLEAEQRRLLMESVAKKMDHEKKVLGCTINRLLHDTDSRMPEILRAVKQYDDQKEKVETELENRRKVLQAEKKLKVLDALDGFPKAIKTAESLLNSVLQERAPKDILVPRRSSRHTDVENPSAKKRKCKETRPLDQSTTTSHGDSWQENEPRLHILNDRESSDVDNPTNKRRIVRNAGGWISPTFSSKLDRSWISKNEPSPNFDISDYVPQIGDIVLYYICGHRMHLEMYPDFLGKKNRIRTRIPIWEKAKQEKIESTKLSDFTDKVTHQPCWWSDEWLNLLDKGDGDMGRYPIICRVERTLTEFPPDRSKIVQKDTDVNGAKLLFKQNDMQNLEEDRSVARVRLAVTLRPLSPVLPPLLDESAIEEPLLLLPPVFSVVTFPSKLDPFLIPFSWAYALSHSLAKEQKVFLKTESGKEEACVESFNHLDRKFGSFRLDDKIRQCRCVLSRFGNLPSSTNFLVKELQGHHSNVFETEAKFVMDVLAHVMITSSASNDDVESYVRRDFSLFELIRSSLPIWNGVSLKRNKYDLQPFQFSPWTMRIPGNAPTSPWQIGSHSFFIEEGLRSKIEVIIQDLINGHEAADIFLYDVKEKDAPSYYCAVPSGMSLSFILLRLRRGAKNSFHGCYYRGIESLLSDVHCLQDNCLLYNDSDSKIVQYASEIVAELRHKITRVVKRHNREISESRKIDEERRSLALHTADNDSTFKGVSSSLMLHSVNRIEFPFKGGIRREWLEQLSQDFLGTEGTGSCWIPQAGDKVIYCSQLHRQFVEGHSSSLEPSQCAVPAVKESQSINSLNVLQDDGNSLHVLQENGIDSVNSLLWRPGSIVWTRASFPKAGYASSNDDVQSFVSSAPLIAVGLQLTDIQDITVVYWRPCVLPSDVKTVVGECPVCGLACSSSFLRLALHHVDDSLHRSSLSIPSPSDLSDEVLQSIDHCLTMLKKRIIDGSSPAAIDKKFTNAILKGGPRKVAVAPRETGLPSYERMLFVEPGFTCNGTSDSTCVQRSVMNENDNSIAKLAQSGFLPLWLKKNGGIDDDYMRLYESLLPNTKLCLEFIQLRLRRHFYRSKLALESDMLEAYVCTVFVVLVQSARRKKSPISVQRVAKLLASKIKAKLNPGDIKNEVLVEEYNFAQRLRVVRNLYAGAIVSASQTLYTEFVFGLRDLSCVEADSLSEENKGPNYVKEEAREKIRALLCAVGKDPQLNRFKKNTYSGDLTRISSTVSCKVGEIPLNELGRDDAPKNGIASQLNNFKRIAHSGDSTRIGLTVSCKINEFPLNKLVNDDAPKCCIAFLNEKIVRVTLVCNGKPFSPRKKKINAPVRGNENGTIRPVTNSKISVPNYPPSCEENDNIARILFGRPDCRNACARCQVIGQSMLTCRVKNAHSNPDYDWLSNLAGAGGVDGLLHALQTGEKVQSSQSDISPTDVLVDEIKTVDLQVSYLSEVKNDGANDEDLDDPTEVFDKAKAALASVEILLNDVKRYAEAPVRFSKDFVSSFPADDEDGHYVYCVVCGLIGDLLCCDGCPNVMHNTCIGLMDVPEGEWFCEECVLSKNNKCISCKPSEICSSNPTNGDNSTESAESVSPVPMPFGRISFDESRILQLSTIVDEIREKRNTIILPTKVKLNDQNMQQHVEVESDTKHALSTSTYEATSVIDSIFVEPIDINLTLSLPPSTDVPPIRKRGRPRKFPLSPPLTRENECVGTTESLEFQKIDEWTENKNVLGQSPVTKKIEGSEILSIDSCSSVPTRALRPRKYIHGVRIFDVGEGNGWHHLRKNSIALESVSKISTRMNTRSSRKKARRK